MSALDIQILHRPRIIQTLEQADRYPLSLIVAPMGYGKTMAVMDFFRSAERRVVWISLTAPVKISDEDYFWVLLTNSLREKVPAFAMRMETMGFPDDAMQILRFLELLRTEAPLEQERLLGMGAEELRQYSHHIPERLGIPHPVPNYRMGRLVLSLNQLRTQSRECELAAAEAFGAEGRPDLIQALNRLSSAFYIVMCRELSQKKEGTP